MLKLFLLTMWLSLCHTAVPLRWDWNEREKQGDYNNTQRQNMTIIFTQTCHYACPCLSTKCPLILDSVTSTQPFPVSWFPTPTYSCVPQCLISSLVCIICIPAYFHMPLPRLSIVPSGLHFHLYPTCASTFACSPNRVICFLYSDVTYIKT